MEKLNIFEPGVTSKEGDEHGWGLVICKRIAEELGEQLLVESTEDYTEFTLILDKAVQNKVKVS